MVLLDRERLGKARTGGFMLPSKVAEYIHEGLELGDADDLVFGTTNSKQVNGAVGRRLKNASWRSPKKKTLQQHQVFHRYDLPAGGTTSQTLS